jgi:hypothetical protein
MARVASLAAEKAAAILSGALVTTAFAAQQIVTQNTAPDLAEKTAGAQYPAIYVYCGKVNNLLREKFRTFSGEAQMVAEVRVSQDRLDGLEAQTQLFAEAVTGALDVKRGDWGDGMFFGGGYEIGYGPVKHGGRNFLQIAKVTFTVEVSIG